MIDAVQALSRLHELSLIPAGKADDILLLLSEVLDAGITLTAADFGNLQLADPATHDLSILVQRGFSDAWVDYWNHQSRGMGACGSALQTKTRTLVEDVSQSALFVGTAALEIQLSAGVRAVQSTPLITRTGKAIGVLSTHWREPRQFAEENFKWIDLLARQAADMIDQAQTALALRRSEDRFRALAMASWDVIYSADPRWERLHVLGGQGIGASPCPTCTDWLDRYIAPPDQDELREAIADAIRKGSGFNIDHRVTWPDGSVGWSHSCAVPLRNEDGDIVEWFGAAHDVTDARLAVAELSHQRRRLEALLQALPVGVAFTDTADCVHVSANAALLELLGAGPDANVSTSASSADHYGSQIDFRHAGQSVAAPDLPLQRAARDRCRVGPTELELILPHGAKRVLEVTAAPITGTEGAVAVLVDVDERRRAEQALEQVRSKDEFLATLSHELRNPLAAITSALDAREDDIDEGEREALRLLVHRQTDVLLRLADDLADVSRASHAQLQLHAGPISMHDLLGTAAMTARAVAHKRQQKLIVHGPPKDVFFEGDRVRLLQVLTNLVDNASKYSGTGSVIELHGYLDGTDVVLMCTDDGPGIEPTLLPTIFEPMVRGHAARTAVPSGLGLGLTLIQRFAQLHGGSASAFSQGAGEGSEFVVRFPFIAARDEAPPDPTDLYCAGTESAMPATFEALLVEDHPDVATATADLLCGVGAVVTTAGTAREAIEIMNRVRPQLLVCDLNLPDMSGLALVARMKSQLSTWGTHVTVVSGFGGAELDVYSRRAEQLGVHQFLSKPLSRGSVKAMRAALRFDGTP